MTTVIQFRNRSIPKARTRPVWPTALGVLAAAAALWALMQLAA
jgi:hypothetical protein